MPTTNSPAAALTSAHRVEAALKALSPRWTVWIAQTLAHGPLQLYEISQRIPFTVTTNTQRRLKQMQSDGLITRTGDNFRASHQLSERGAALTPVFAALTDWSHQHLQLGPTAGAERIEDALGRLHLHHTTSVVELLRAQGTARFTLLAEQAAMGPGTVWPRLTRMQDDGLLTRTGPYHGDPYTLTPAGRALGKVYAAVDQWSTSIPTERPPLTPVPVTAAQRTHPAIPLGSDRDRSAAALRRSPAVPAAVFSHSPQPHSQPNAPATVRPAPFRSR